MKKMLLFFISIAFYGYTELSYGMEKSQIYFVEQATKHKDQEHLLIIINQMDPTRLNTACYSIDSARDFVFPGLGSSRYRSLNILHLISYYGIYDLISTCVKRGADINCQSSFGQMTPLEIAVRQHKLKTVLELLKNGADPLNDQTFRLISSDPGIYFKELILILSFLVKKTEHNIQHILKFPEETVVSFLASKTHINQNYIQEIVQKLKILKLGKNNPRL